jgi:HK97 family phage major capsid protein
LIIAMQVLEEALFVGGSGTGQAQGLIGNCGAGVTCATHAYADILDSTFDVMGTLNAVYHQDANWLMQRATAIGIRKAQKQANLFEPVFVRENGQDYLHGYKVVYSTSMPAVGAAAKPILFGSFKSGYVIGDRGGSGINVKILDQPKATEGQLVLLAYRRVDGRVRRSEAIQTLALT